MSTAHLVELNLIKRVLEEKGLKQTWLSEKLGKSYAIVNANVQNRKQPRLEVLYEIASILQVDLKELSNSNIKWIMFELKDITTALH
jgi:ribosome-binding protein aMBF1 (putative translation factor)